MGIQDRLREEGKRKHALSSKLHGRQLELTPVEDSQETVQNTQLGLGAVAHACNRRTLGGRGRQIT